MKPLISIVIGFAICGLCCDKTFAWAREGHEVVAVIAQRLMSPATKSKIEELLAHGGDKDLVSIACWADEVVLAARGEGPLSEDKEALDFNKRFPNNRMWHFVNLPLGTMSYEQARKFTSPDDIIHAISRCIDVLEAPAAEESKQFTKVQALRLLVHFVADIHQPLHCGAGYYSFDESEVAQIVSSPAEAFGKPSDRGGNLLFYGMNPTDQLHALWDSGIVEKIAGSTSYEVLAGLLSENGISQEITPGDYRSWAESWALDSVRVATLAYLGIAFGKAEFDNDRNLIRIGIILPANYVEANEVYAAEQLRRAAVRLAQLLDSIKW